MEIEVLINEITKMKKYFPGFTLKKSSIKNEAFFWQGWVSPLGLRKWEIQLTYEECYPIVLNKELGGIRISVINPDIFRLTEQYKKTTHIPHVNTVVFNNMLQVETCLCVMESSYYDSKKIALNAVQSCALACKWLALFEMWLMGIVGEEFEKEGVF